jgi:hypothetical protein
VPVPYNARGRTDLVRLGDNRAAVWFAAPGLIAGADLQALGGSFAHRVGGWRDPVVPIHLDDEALTAFVGPRLVRCTAAGCVEKGRTTAPPIAVVGGAPRWLVAVPGKTGGVYRLGPTTAAAPASLELLVAGSAEPMCGGGDDAWAVVTRGAEARLVAVSVLSGAARVFGIDEALLVAARAGALPDGAALAALAERALQLGGPLLADLAKAAATDPRPPVRAVAARLYGWVDGGRAVAALWLLGHDPEKDVRAASLAAVTARCRPRGRSMQRPVAFGSPQGCTAMLMSFTDDADIDIAWDARDALLEHDVSLALEDATTPYKLDVLPRLMLRADRDTGALVGQALKLLLADDDAEVRALAGAVVDHATP